MKQYIKALIEKATDTGFSFIASTDAVDRQGDVIDQAGWDIANYMNNPVMLWAHDYSSLPVAKATSINPNDPRGLVGTAEFAPAEGNPFAAQLKVMVEEGFVSALSVGFIPKERNGKVISKSELLEISFVPVPANQEALMLAAKSLTAHGFATEAVEKFIASMKEGEEQIAEEVAPAEETAEEVAPEAPAETTEEVETKGPVSDEMDAEEAYEAKWANMDQFFDIIGAVCDVYLDENTPVDAFGAIMLEASGLIAALGQGASEDEGMQMAAYAKLVKKSIGIDSKKALATLIEKVGARHSATTKDALQEAKDHADAISTVLGAMLEGTASTEDGTAVEDDETDAEKGADAMEGKDAARALLEVRGILRERTDGDQSVLRLINRHLVGRA